MILTGLGHLFLHYYYHFFFWEGEGGGGGLENEDPGQDVIVSYTSH